MASIFVIFYGDFFNFHFLYDEKKTVSGNVLENCSFPQKKFFHFTFNFLFVRTLFSSDLH